MMTSKFTLRPYQKDASNAAVSAFNKKGARSGIMVLPTGCHEKGYKVVMSNGSMKKVEDIKVGDRLLGTDGYRTVLELHHGFDDMYKITPIKGRPFVVNGGHILVLHKTKEDNRYPAKVDYISVNDYLKQCKKYKQLYKLFRLYPVAFEGHNELPLPPYLLGLKQKKNHMVTSFSVEYVGRGEYFGFTLDGNNLYLDEQFFVQHNSGKSLIIADILSKIDDNVIVFQPNKEILEQNYAKLQTYGIKDCSIYSASLNKKQVARITFATIGSVIRRLDLFKDYHKVIIDESHLVASDAGMYKKFIEDVDRVVIGFTATPYRLTQRFDGMSELKFITRSRPRIFSYVYHVTQTSELCAKGFLSPINYYDITSLDMTRVMSNSTGSDYDEASLKMEYMRSDFYTNLICTIRRLLKPKSGIPRRGILVFTRFVEEAEKVCRDIEGSAIVHGELSKKEREDILTRFKSGEIKVVVNVGVLTVGFDYPELDTVLMARPTKSLALYYQIVGRILRPYRDENGVSKIGWFVDMCGNFKRFGRVEDLKVEDLGRGKWVVTSHGKQLTNVPM